MRARRSAPAAALVAGAIAMVGCAGPTDPVAVPQPTTTAPASPSPDAGEPELTGPVQPAGAPDTLIAGLNAPWAVTVLPSGSALITERDTARIVEYTAAGEARVIGTIPGVRHGGEGGLMGIAHLTDDRDWIYVMHTAADDNRIIRVELLGDPGAHTLGDAEVVLDGIPRAGNHNGGRLKFGDDGMLYATTGDAGDRDLAQDPESLAGKILRMTPDGSAPADNPLDGSLVYSLGHRNPQGLAWDADGTLWAAEFGQNTWDELNRITPGGNYGWPIVEGTGGGSEFIDPIVQWATAEASPSGLAHVADTFFLAALRGRTLWSVDAASASATPWFAGEFGRLRDVIVVDNALWVLTNNTDGRGTPSEGDDRLLRIRLEPVS